MQRIQTKVKSSIFCSRIIQLGQQSYHTFKWAAFLPSFTKDTGQSGNAEATALAPIMFVRFDKPTKNSRPVKNTSVPSRLASGSFTSTMFRPSFRKMDFVISASRRLDNRYGWVISAVPSHITDTQSMKALSGNVSSDCSSITSKLSFLKLFAFEDYILVEISNRGFIQL